MLPIMIPAMYLLSCERQAAAEGQTKIVSFLISSKANINPKDRYTSPV
jgi:hypothetical protein